MQNSFDIAHRSPALANADRINHPDGTPIEVLVVDDEAALSELISMVLRYEGWSVSTVGDGAAAIRHASVMCPDVVVLDIMLPDMSGLDVLQELHRIRPELPVLLLTAKDTVEDKIAGLAFEPRETKMFFTPRMTIVSAGLDWFSLQRKYFSLY